VTKNVIRPTHPFNEPQENLAKSLNKFHVIFLVIGGRAVCAHSDYRQTSDLDILLSHSKGNALRLADAFNLHSSRTPDGEKWADVFAQENKRIIYPYPHNHEADLLTSIDGIHFGRCYERSIQVAFGTLVLRVPNVPDLIQMKKQSMLVGNDVAAHLKDAADIAELQKLL
jgi:hypothetical protein